MPELLQLHHQQVPEDCEVVEPSWNVWPADPANFSTQNREGHFIPEPGPLELVGVKRLPILRTSKVRPVNTQQAIIVVVTFVPVVEKDLKKGERTDEIEVELNFHLPHLAPNLPIPE